MEHTEQKENGGIILWMVIGKDIRYNTIEEAVIMNEKMFYLITWNSYGMF